MRIASVTMQAKGGAGLSSHKLHKQFVRDGHESRLLVAKESWNRDGVELLPNDSRYTKNWWNLGTVPLAPRVQNIVSSGLAGKSVSALDEVRNWADVVLLRWVTATVSDFQIARWSHGDTPIVWCLSDMAPLTGGCHYSNGCFQYESTCGRCQMVSPAFQHVPATVLQRRSRLWRRLTVVSPSRWLADCARNSIVLRGQRVEIIRTGVELDIFYPEPREPALQRFGLDPARSTILFGADSVTEIRKGFSLLLQALNQLIAADDQRKLYQLLVVGGSVEAAAEALASLGVPYAATGHLASRTDLRQAYAAADVVALPYLEDNLPNVMLEAIACGIPVVSFATGGMKDVVVEGINGVTAIPFDTFDFSHCIRRVLSARLQRADLHDWARRHIDIRDQAHRYIELFSELRAAAVATHGGSLVNPAA